MRKSELAYLLWLASRYRPDFKEQNEFGCNDYGDKQKVPIGRLIGMLLQLCMALYITIMSILFLLGEVK